MRRARTGDCEVRAGPAAIFQCGQPASSARNDLLRGLASDAGRGVRAFERKLEAFLISLPVRPVFVGTVYDPTFGDDSRNFLGVPAKIARANHRRVNEVIARLALRYGQLVDLHAHFLLGEPAWFTRTIEPSLLGASEVRRAFLHGPPPVTGTPLTRGAARRPGRRFDGSRQRPCTIPDAAEAARSTPAEDHRQTRPHHCPTHPDVVETFEVVLNQIKHLAGFTPVS